MTYKKCYSTLASFSQTLPMIIQYLLCFPHIPSSFFFQLHLPICFCISKQKTWSIQRLTPMQSSVLLHPSSTPLFWWNSKDSTPLSPTAWHQQAFPSNTTGVLHTWCPKFQAKGADKDRCIHVFSGTPGLLFHMYRGVKRSCSWPYFSYSSVAL